MLRVWLVGCVALSGIAAWGDGMFAEPVLSERVQGRAGVASTEQKGVVIELPRGREALVLQTTYHGPAEKFAWVVPVPGKPSRDDVFLASPVFIDELLKGTAPEIKTKIIDPRRKPLLAMPRPFEPMSKSMGGPPPGMAGGSPLETVTVHDRMEVGDYDVVILSATGTDALSSWLAANGFRLPDKSESILDHYISQSWYFVALRMQTGKAQLQPVLKDVAPIAIRFAATKLIYPLYISRAGSRESTALTLVTLTRSPVKCDTYPDVSLPVDTRFRKGVSYATLRREAVQRAGAGLVCEYRGPNGMPYIDVDYKKDAWSAGDVAPPGFFSTGYLWTTRYWTLLKRDDMQDVSFSPVEDRATLRVNVERLGFLHVPFFGTSVGATTMYGVLAVGLFGLAASLARQGYRMSRAVLPVLVASPFGAVLLLVAAVTLHVPLPILCCGVLLAIAVAVYRSRRPRPGREPGEGLSPREMARGAFIAVGLVVLGHTVLALTFQRQFLTDDPLGIWVGELWQGGHSMLVEAVVILAQLTWSLVVIDWMRGSLREAGAGAAWTIVPAAFLGLIVAAGLDAQFHGASSFFDLLRPQNAAPLAASHAAAGAVALPVGVLTLLSLILVLSFLIACPAGNEKSRRLVQPLCMTLVGTLVIGCLASFVLSVTMTPAHAGTLGFSRTGNVKLDGALSDVDKLLAGFIAEHGCYPKELKDALAGARPQGGVDSSGNAVPISLAESIATTERGAGELPEDPLTGRTDTWVYEPTGSPMVDSGGYEVKLTATPFVHSEDIAKWSPDRQFVVRREGGRPELPDAARQYYFTNSHTAFSWGSHAVDLDDPTWRQPGAWRQIFHAPSGIGVATVNVAAHGAMVGNPAMDAPVFAASPDGEQVVAARNHQRTASIDLQTIRTQQLKMLLPGPWDVVVQDIDWHPTERKWLIVAGPRETKSGRDLYLMGEDGRPHRIAERGDVLVAKFSPDGGSILAIVADGITELRVFGQGQNPIDWKRAVGHAGTRLLRMSLDGRELGLVADSPLPQPWFSSREGSVLVLRAPADGNAYSLLVMGKDGSTRRIGLPVAAPQASSGGRSRGEEAVRDLWTDGREIAAVFGGWRGGVWRRPFGEGSWRQVADYEGDPCPAIIGVDRPTGALIVTMIPVEHGENLTSTFALRDDDPKLELLLDSTPPARGWPRDVDIAGKQCKVTSDGVYWLPHFKVGDIVAENAFPSDILSAQIVSAVDADSVVIGGTRVSFERGTLPCLRRGGPAHCYEKFRRQ